MDKNSLPKRIDQEWLGAITPGNEHLGLHEQGLSELREQLIGQHEFLDEQEVTDYLRERAGVEAVDLEFLRESGAILAVHDHGVWLYPVFQFDPEAGAISPLIAEANSAFLAEDTGWSRLAWWSAPRTHTPRHQPLSDVLHDPDGEKYVTRVIDTLNPQG